MEIAVDGVMVMRAEQRQIVQRGGAALEPRNHVVGFAPAGGTIAAGERAATVAGNQRAPQRSGHQASVATRVEHLTCSAENQRQDHGVTRQLAHRRR